MIHYTPVCLACLLLSQCWCCMSCFSPTHLVQVPTEEFLIREYKNVKDRKTKMEGELKEMKETLETKDKEIEQLKTATTTKPVVNVVKDVIQVNNALGLLNGFP